MRKLLILSFMLLGLFISACDTTLVTLQAKDKATEIIKGKQKLALETYVNGVINTGVTYEILEGSDIATIDQNHFLSVKNEAEVGSKVKIVSKYKEYLSNELTITVIEEVLLTRIDISTKEEYDFVEVGDQIEILTELTPANTTEKDNIIFEIIEGSEIASIDGNILTINESAENGDIIKVVSKRESITSNTLIFTVKKFVSFSIKHDVTSGVTSAGDVLNFSYTVTPAEITIDNTKITYEITSGEEFASLENNVLTINEEVEIGSEIKVKGKYTASESEIIYSSNEIVVKVSTEDGKKLIFAEESLDVYNPHDTENILEITIFNNYGEPISDEQNISYTLEDNTIVEISTENVYAPVFTALKHGQTTLTITLETGETETVTINSIVTPENIELDEVFIGSRINGIDYSNRDPLDFIVNITGDNKNNVSQEINYSFKLFNDTTNEYEDTDLVTYTNGKIDFGTVTGTVLVTALTNSGNASKYEKKLDYIVRVNDGYNISTWEQLHDLLEKSSDYDQSKKVNIFSKTKIDEKYILTPNILTNANVNNFSFNNNSDILEILITKNVFINGNNFTLDFSNLKQANSQQGRTELLNFSPILGSPLNITINDLVFIGSSSIEEISDVYQAHAIRVNGGLPENQKAYVNNLSLNNLTIKNFETGLQIRHVVSGNISNTTVENNYSNGVELVASILTLNNITLKNNGAFGLELTPDSNGNAGPSFDQNQNITITGDFISDNTNAGNTHYFSKYKLKIGGTEITIPQVITGIITAYEHLKPGISSHIKNSNNELDFALLKIHDVEKMVFNNSILNYDDSQVIDIKDINNGEINTTHKYIKFDLLVSHLGIAGLDVAGYAIMTNQNYIEPTK